MRKCAQCGKDIPKENSTCNYCGYNSENYNNKAGYSFGQPSNYVTYSDENKKIGKSILIIVLIVFFAPIIIWIIFILFSLLFLFVTLVFEDNNSMDCPSYCNGEYVYKNNECYCAESEIFDEYDNSEDNFNDIDFDSLSDNIHIFETNTLELDRYVNNKEDVVVVVCSDFATSCNEYAIRMLDIAQKENFNLFIYKYELLDEENKDKLLDYYLGVYSEFNPLTFIMSNGKMKKAHEKNMIKSEIEDYLMNNGIM